MLFFSFTVVPIVLVGNKKDLWTDPDTTLRLAESGEELITKMDGLAVAGRIGACAYLECSAKLNEGVTEVLEMLARASLPKTIKKKRKSFFRRK